MTHCKVSWLLSVDIVLCIVPKCAVSPSSRVLRPWC